MTTQWVIYAEDRNQVKEYARIHDNLLSYTESGRFMLSFYVQKVSETQSSLTITAHFEGFENVSTHSWHPLQSEGVLEREILDSIRREVAARPTPSVAPAVAADSTSKK
jgi:hypothetical protein